MGNAMIFPFVSLRLASDSRGAEYLPSRPFSFNPREKMILFVADAVCPFLFPLASAGAILGAGARGPKLEEEFARVALSR